MIDSKLIAEGKAYTIKALTEDNQCQLESFIRTCYQNPQLEKYIKGIYAYLKLIADDPEGPRCLSKNICHVAHSNFPKIYRIRKGPIRIYFFSYGNKIICLLDGNIKKTQQPNKKFIERLDKLRTKYIKEK